MKFRVSLLFLFYLSLTLCHLRAVPTLDSEIKISAMQTEYNGHQLLLTGNVLIEHEFGSLSSGKASAPLRKGKGDPRFTLEEQVVISLSGGGSLCCSRATLNGQSMRGKFYSLPGNPPIRYQGYTEDSQGVLTPLGVSSDYMCLQMDRNSEAEDYHVEALQAEGDVRIRYGPDIKAQADFANYSYAGRDSAHSPFPGTITLWPRRESQCTVYRGSLDHIKAQKIRIDTVTHQIAFSCAMGEFFLMQDNVPKDRIDFSANHIQWLEKEDLLQLRGDVSFHEREMGSVTTEELVTAQFIWKGGKRDLHHIKTQGPTHIVYHDFNKGTKHTVYCPGEVWIDHTKKCAYLNGLAQGSASTSQIHYRDSLGDLYADRIILWYSQEEEEPQLTKLVLEGNVRMRNIAALDAEDTQPGQQYAWSDQAVFLPQKRELTLSAETSGRVLFYDKVRNLKMSAPGIQVRRDGSGDKKTIQGLGNVRFTFARHEALKMEQLFQFKDLVADVPNVIEKLN